MSAHAQCAPGRRIRTDHEVADIFRAHGEAYRATHVLSPQQREVMRAIENCRTPVLGGHLDLCPECGYERPSYNSCRNRHCPKCLALEQARWVEHQKQRILPTQYFHVVFTLPHELHGLTRRNSSRIYDLLFRAASQSLLELGRDPKRLGALLGFTAVLHTWTRDLKLHPHLHCLVTGGGLSPDRQHWVDARRGFLFYVKVLSSLFRGKFLHGLAILHAQGKLDLGPGGSKSAAFQQLRRTLFKKDWVVYLKPPFAGPEQVVAYVGRYTHRVAISNRRILEVSEDHVIIATKNGQTATMTPEVFIQRFLQHVLPKGFIKIRHFGLMASTHVRTLLPLAKQLLGGLPDLAPAVDDVTRDSKDWQDLMLELTGIDPRVCPKCGHSPMLRVPLPPATPTPQRLPP